MKRNILKIIGFVLFFLLTTFGMLFVIKNEEDGRPKFEIQQDHNTYYTSKYTSDTHGCIYFTYVRGKKYYNIVLCGKYSIKEKIKENEVLGQQ